MERINYRPDKDNVDLKKLVLSKRETSEIIDKLRPAWPEGIVPKVKTITSYEVEEGKRLLISDEILAAQINDAIVPFLGSQAPLQHFPFVTVDAGAVKFVCNGAKVMRPGITDFGDFKKGEIVGVKDPTRGKIIAVGIALEDSESAKAMSKGYVVENLHYVGDKMWQAYKEI